MRLSLFILTLLNFSLVACGSGTSGDEISTEKEVINDNSNGTQAVDPGQPVDDNTPPLALADKALDDAYQSFLAQGVPKIALTRAFEFYRNNRASTGGLQNTSCILKPMSETGEIEKNSNRYDPTTLSMLKTGIRNERYIMVIDYMQPNSAERGYLMDLQADSSGKYKLVKILIANGYGSQAVNGIPTVFTNSANHGTTVAGFFITAASTYHYYGHSGGNEYESIGMRLYGLESTNNTAEQTSKVAHGAPYVSDTRAGNSAGCAAMKPTNAEKYLPVLKGGMLWYHHNKANNSLTFKAPSC